MAAISKINRDWIVVVCINSTIPILLLWKLHTGEINHKVALYSCWFCFVFLNFLYVFVVWARDRRMGRTLSRTFALEVAGIGLGAALLTSFSLQFVRSKNNYLALASSNKPLSSIEPERDRLVVGLIRRRAANSQQYAVTAAQMRAIAPALYSVESFASVDAIGSTVGQLDHAFDLDAAYAAKQKEALDDFTKRMAIVDSSYLRSWELGYHDQEDAEDRTFALEEDWIKSVQDLYKYVADHHKEIIVRDGAMKFSSPEVKENFEHDLDRSKQYQTDVQLNREELLKRQQRATLSVTRD